MLFENFYEPKTIINPHKEKKLGTLAYDGWYLAVHIEIQKDIFYENIRNRIE